MTLGKYWVRGVREGKIVFFSKITPPPPGQAAPRE